MQTPALMKDVTPQKQTCSTWHQGTPAKLRGHCSLIPKNKHLEETPHFANSTPHNVNVGTKRPGAALVSMTNPLSCVQVWRRVGVCADVGYLRACESKGVKVWCHSQKTAIYLGVWCGSFLWDFAAVF